MRKSTILLTTASALALTGAVVWQLRPQPSPSPAAAHSTSSSTRLVRLHDREAALAERLKVAREISDDLTNEELRQLMATLARPLDQRTAEKDLMAFNEIMEQLRVSGMACGEYATALCSLIREEKTHPVVRDYAMQHAVQWIREAKSGHSLARISEDDRRNLLSCIVSYLQVPTSLHETGYGTALNLIRTLANEYPADAAEIFALCAPRISAVASGQESGPLGNRISAIQSLPALPDREQALTLVRNLTTDTPGGSPVRLVAIATLGLLGEESDLATLRRIQTENSDFSYAARAAAARLTANIYSTTR